MDPVVQWILVFISTTAADVAWTRYNIEVQRLDPLRASSWSSAIYLLGSFTTWQFVHNFWLFTAGAVGAFVGTYVTLIHEKRKV